MTDPELLKLARQARTALWVIAASCATLALIAAWPLLSGATSWVFESPARAMAVVTAILVIAMGTVTFWVILTDVPTRPAAPKPE